MSSIENSNELWSAQNSPGVTDKVFFNDMLLEIILKYVICGLTNNVNCADLRSVRLVNTFWLETASKIIRMSKHIVFCSLLRKTQSPLFSKNVKRKRRTIDQFVTLLSSRNYLEISLLPVHVYLILSYFRVENYYSLLSFLTKCGEHLKYLDVEFPHSGGTLPVTFPQFDLPNLHKIKFIFMDTVNSQVENNSYAKGNIPGLTFLQSLLNASSKLKVFELASRGNHSMPENVEYLQLPDTLTTIMLENYLKTECTELLLQSNLPVLQELWLSKAYSDEGEILVSKVLDRYRKTLKRLCFYDWDEPTLPFPLMESLDELRLRDTIDYEENDCNSAFHKLMPKLKKIVLDYDIDIWVTKLTNMGGFTSVEEIYLESASDVNLELMERLHKALPNLQRLSFSVDVKQLSALKYVLTQMNKLKLLKIRVCGKLKHRSSKIVKAVLSTFSKEELQPSLLNLPELQVLHLTTEFILKDGEMSLLTNSLFEHGLQEMSNLQTLLLSGKFKPTIEMQEEWRKQGKFMEYRDGVICGSDQTSNPFEFFT